MSSALFCCHTKRQKYKAQIFLLLVISFPNVSTRPSKNISRPKSKVFEHTTSFGPKGESDSDEKIIINSASLLFDTVDLSWSKYEIFTKEEKQDRLVFKSQSWPGTEYAVQRNRHNQIKIVVVDKNDDDILPSQSDTHIVFLQDPSLAGRGMHYTAHVAHIRTLPRKRSVEWDLYHSKHHKSSYNNFYSAFNPTNYFLNSYSDHEIENYTPKEGGLSSKAISWGNAACMITVVKPPQCLEDIDNKDEIAILFKQLKSLVKSIGNPTAVVPDKTTITETTTTTPFAQLEPGKNIVPPEIIDEVVSAVEASVLDEVVSAVQDEVLDEVASAVLETSLLDEAQTTPAPSTSVPVEDTTMIPPEFLDEIVSAVEMSIFDEVTITTGTPTKTPEEDTIPPEVLDLIVSAVQETIFEETTTSNQISSLHGLTTTGTPANRLTISSPTKVTSGPTIDQNKLTAIKPTTSKPTTSKLTTMKPTTRKLTTVKSIMYVNKIKATTARQYEETTSTSPSTDLESLVIDEVISTVQNSVLDEVVSALQSSILYDDISSTPASSSDEDELIPQEIIEEVVAAVQESLLDEVVSAVETSILAEATTPIPTISSPGPLTTTDSPLSSIIDLVFTSLIESVSDKPSCNATTTIQLPCPCLTTTPSPTNKIEDSFEIVTNSDESLDSQPLIDIAKSVENESPEAFQDHPKPTKPPKKPRRRKGRKYKVGRKSPHKRVKFTRFGNGDDELISESKYKRHESESSEITRPGGIELDEPSTIEPPPSHNHGSGKTDDDLTTTTESATETYPPTLAEEVPIHDDDDEASLENTSEKLKKSKLAGLRCKKIAKSRPTKVNPLPGSDSSSSSSELLKNTKKKLTARKTSTWSGAGHVKRYSCPPGSGSTILGDKCVCPVGTRIIKRKCVFLQSQLSNQRHPFAEGNDALVYVPQQVQFMLADETSLIEDETMQTEVVKKRGIIIDGPQLFDVTDDDLYFAYKHGNDIKNVTKINFSQPLGQFYKHDILTPVFDKHYAIHHLKQMPVEVLKQFVTNYVIKINVNTGRPRFESKRRPFTGIMDCKYEEIPKVVEETWIEKTVDYYLHTLRAQCHNSIRSKALDLFKKNLTSLSKSGGIVIQLHIDADLMHQHFLSESEWEDYISAIYLSKYSESFSERKSKFVETSVVGDGINLSPYGNAISHSIRTLSLFVEKVLQLLQLDQFQRHAVKITTALMSTLSTYREKVEKEAFILHLICKNCPHERLINKEDAKQLGMLGDYVIFGAREVIQSSLTFYDFCHYRKNSYNKM